MPKGTVLSVCGAGGKTSLIRALRDHYRSLKWSVLVTTSTHMQNEGGLLSGADEIRGALINDGYAFAGREDPENAAKIISLPERVLGEILPYADITLIEADGARHKSFKVPYPHEPVIVPATTRIAVIYGMYAAGRRIRDAAYNAAGAAEALGLSEEDVLTEERMREALQRTYAAQLNRRYPDIPVSLIPRPPRRERRYHFIYLAAGYSSRFGANKLFYPVLGKPMYRHALDILSEIRAERKIPADITVVTQYEDIYRQAESLGALAVINPDPSRGISSSLQTGIRALLDRDYPGSDDALIFIGADQPFIRKESLVNFILRTESSGKRLSAFSFHGEMYSPCLFHISYIPELMELSGDTGGKRILKARRDRVYLFETGDFEELRDFDTADGFLNKIHDD